MDAHLRNTPGLINRVEKLRDELIKRFEALIACAGTDRMDRNTTAITQYQMQVETAALIRATEDFQALIRQLQEMWLFGQLSTMGETQVQKQTNENAKNVAKLLQQLVELQKQTPATTTGVNGREEAAMENGS